MTSEDRYIQHREGCVDCGAVDIGMRGIFRCKQGRDLVRTAAHEKRLVLIREMDRHKAKARRIPRKPFITAKDFVFMKQLAIKL